jgi:hypothetical protein
VRLETLGQLEDSNDFIGTQTSYLSVGSIALQPITLSRAPCKINGVVIITKSHYDFSASR